MHILYPAIKCSTSDLLQVSDNHKIYYEESGSLDGLPVLVLHNGPGATGNSSYRRFFDPEKYRIIIMDQRGSGQSAQFGNVTDNNTSALLLDIEKLREHLKVEKWVVFGCGWGGMLGLLYAEANPDVIKGLLVVGTQLCGTNDLEWFYSHGANVIFPDYWNDFISHLKPQELGDIVHYYHKKLNGSDDLVTMGTAKSWAMWHANCSSLQPHKYLIEQNTNPHFAYGSALVLSHYLVNKFFTEENKIINNIEAISSLPSVIIHGRYDMVSPLESAWELHNILENSKLFIVRDAGHEPLEIGLIDAIIVASNQLHNDLKE